MEISDEPKLSIILKNNQPVLFRGQRHERRRTTEELLQNKIEGMYWLQHMIWNLPIKKNNGQDMNKFSRLDIKVLYQC